MNSLFLNKPLAHHLQVFYPASIFNHEFLKQGLHICKHTLNFEVCETAIPEPHHFYAASTKERAHSFLKALYGPANLLWAARGGYGSIEWLDQLPTEKKHYKNKQVIGFSDLTALHAFLSNIGLSSIHGPMIATKGFSEATPVELKSLLLALSEQPQAYEVQQGQEREGRLIGGNLSVLSHLMGTPWQLQLQKGDLLFLEDINEAPYALARSLKQLSYSPHFEHCHILWGQLTQCGNETEKELLNILMGPYKNSWSYGLNAGHDTPNYSLRLGAKAHLKKDALFQ